MMSNYTFKARKTSQPGRRLYQVMRNSDELVLGEIYRDGPVDQPGGWTACDISGCESWPFTDRESAAQSLEIWRHRAISRLTGVSVGDVVALTQPEMIDEVRQLTLDDFDRAQECARFLIESFGAGLGPVFSCAEADTLVTLGWSCGLDDDLLDRFKRSHVHDDEPGDRHYSGWPTDDADADVFRAGRADVRRPEDSEEIS